MEVPVLCASHASDAAGQALTTSYASVNLGTAPNAAPVSENAYVPIPEKWELDHLEVQVTSIAGGATTLTAFLSWDTNGDYAACNEAASTIKTGKTTVTKGTAYFILNRPLVRPPGLGTAGALYLWLKTDAGTCTAVGRAYGRRVV